MRRVLLFTAKSCRWLLLLVIAALPAAAQTPVVPDAKAQGLALYRQGDYPKAIELLQKATQQNPSDAEAWYLLGLASLEKKDFKQARQAFAQVETINPVQAGLYSQLAYLNSLEDKNEAASASANRALELNKDDVLAHYIKGILATRKNQWQEAVEESRLALKTNPDFAAAHTLRYQSIMSLIGNEMSSPNPSAAQLTIAMKRENYARQQRLYGEAADSLEAQLRLTPSAGNTNESRTILETLRAHSGAAMPDPVFSANDVTSKAIMKSRPEPAFTDQARNKGVRGTVILRLALAADGTVKYILPLTYLPYGLTEQAMKAAQGVKFTPAQKDGRAVSQWVQIEYSFN